MGTFLIEIDNNNYIEISYFLQQVLFINGYLWDGNNSNLKTCYNKHFLLCTSKKEIYYAKLIVYNYNYQRLVDDFNLKYIYNVNKFDDILTFIKRHQIKEFDINKFLKLIKSDFKDVSVSLYKNKKINEYIKRFNDFQNNEL